MFTYFQLLLDALMTSEDLEVNRVSCFHSFSILPLLKSHLFLFHSLFLSEYLFSPYLINSIIKHRRLNNEHKCKKNKIQT